jgi:ubiquinone/menaquinone biosynthesis C-methylase UbiE
MKKLIKSIQNLFSSKSNVVSASISDKKEEIMYKQIQECRDTHDVLLGPDVTYFDLAEPAMDDQWNEHIYPNIKDFDLSICIDLASGHGRNTNKLREYSKEIHLVDVNQSCIDACKKRFGEKDEKCSFFYYVNDGHTLKEISSNTMQFIYSWDAMVHFDKLVVKDYVKEFFRVLRSGGYGFVHHSNYGVINSSHEWMNNPGWRTNMTAQLFVDYCNEAGLKIVKQQLINNDLDCISIFCKP